MQAALLSIVKCKPHTCLAGRDGNRREAGSRRARAWLRSLVQTQGERAGPVLLMEGTHGGVRAKDLHSLPSSGRNFCRLIRIVRLGWNTAVPVSYLYLSILFISPFLQKYGMVEQRRNIFLAH